MDNIENVIFEGHTVPCNRIVGSGRIVGRSKLVKGCYVWGFDIDEKGQNRKVHTIVTQTEEQKKTGDFTSYMVIPETVRQISNPRHRLDEAIAQFIGFNTGSQGFSILTLANSMNLTKEEWTIIKKEEHSFEGSQIIDIDNYFKEKSD